MRTDAVILMDTESSGRYFDVRTYGVTAFASLAELLRLCQCAPQEVSPAANGMQPACYPAKGELVSLPISVYIVDQAGAHGKLRISPAKHATFKSNEELERLIHEKTCHVLERRDRLSGKQVKE